MTTRCANDGYTVHRALTENMAPDGGIYIPLRLQPLEKAQLSGLIEDGFCGTVAFILNYFFATRLNSWDVEFCIGRSPVNLVGVGRKVIVAETWQNPGASYGYAVSSLNTRLMIAPNAPVGSWMAVASGIAYIFGIYAELCRNGSIDGEDTFDICLPEGSFALPSAAIYAKQMGLPIGKVIIASGSSSAVWDLINRGQMGTSLLQPAQKVGMERLIYAILGGEQVADYVAACNRHGVFSLSEESLDILPSMLFGAVVGKDRVRSIISNVNKSFGYTMSDETAVCYGGVQDYRAKTGQGGTVVVFGTNRPQ